MLGSAPAPSPHRAPDLILSPSVSASGHCQHLHHLTRMNSLVSWQLMLLLCATSFRETLEKVAPMETPGPAGMHCLGRGWEGAHELLENESYHIFQSEASLLMPRPRPRPRPRGSGARRGDLAVPASREPSGGEDLPAYNWTVFGLLYGRRRAATPGLRVNPKPQARDPGVGGAWGCGPEEK
nr:metastasis-suppressor KiSS-1 [Vulpes vulpes]